MIHLTHSKSWETGKNIYFCLSMQQSFDCVDQEETVEKFERYGNRDTWLKLSWEICMGR